MPESWDPSPPRPDVAGLGLSIVALTALVYAIVEAPARGWTSATVLGSLALAAVAGAAFVARERRASEPMLDLRLFRNPRLAWGTVAMTLAGLAIGGLAFELTQYLQFAQGYSPLEAGLRFLPIAVGFGLASPITQRVVARAGTARTVATALGGAAAVFLALSFVDADTSYWLVGPPLLLIGLGLGAALVPATDAVMAAMPEANAGLGSAINDTGRQVGTALGVGILGALANVGYRAGIGDAAAPLGPGAAEAVERSFGAALEIAAQAGGAAGQALERAATAAFMDGFGVAMVGGAVLLGVGAIAVLRRLPSRDVVTASVSQVEPIAHEAPPELARSGGHTEGDG